MKGTIRFYGILFSAFLIAGLPGYAQQAGRENKAPGAAVNTAVKDTTAEKHDCQKLCCMKSTSMKESRTRCCKKDCCAMESDSTKQCCMAMKDCPKMKGKECTNNTKGCCCGEKMMKKECKRHSTK